MELPLELISLKVVYIALACIVIYTIYGGIWRLYFSPISHFPGPKTAALSFWYEFYYDVFPNFGQYVWHIAKLHEKYGPVVRINPYELHIETPEFYETLYSSSRKWDKWYWFTKMYGMDNSSVATVEHVKHRERRAALNQFFSPMVVRRLQPVIDEKVALCIKRLRDHRDSGEPIKCVVMATAFANDVVMQYAFGRTHKRLQAIDFDEKSYQGMHEGALIGSTMKHMIWILRTVKKLPQFMIGQMLRDAFAELGMVKSQLEKTIEERNMGTVRTNNLTIFDELLDSKLSPEEKFVERLNDEATLLIVAGSETTAWTLTVALYHLLANPVVLRRLKNELFEMIPDPTTRTPLPVLENLSYLKAVVKEALRLSYGATSRLSRVSHEPLIFATAEKEWVIPPSTPVSMTSVLLHHNERIYPNPRKFDPRRWLDNPRLERYLASFSKGSRQCAGMHLAHAELYLWLAGVFRSFGSKDVRFESDEGILELVDTEVEDVELWADSFLPVIAPGRKGVIFRVTS
ncbi:cytochrome P450 [Bisporella sp. PMI_857]|nr:cytochrome P450 [Bisporella sp. PMI_857]